ncbi:hypothetical protein L484_021818 [Morus notabilis]|uniref:Uncharacterized protein n=1 Tax=Morus notabilis TaxID=981085 RepID=W9R3U4_9ROSA|nr:hypothetical protein L484_021818 [Morus notabilis]
MLRTAVRKDLMEWPSPPKSAYVIWELMAGNNPYGFDIRLIWLRSCLEKAWVGSVRQGLLIPRMSSRLVDSELEDSCDWRMRIFGKPRRSSSYYYSCSKVFILAKNYGWNKLWFECNSNYVVIDLLCDHNEDVPWKYAARSSNWPISLNYLNSMEFNVSDILDEKRIK